MDILTILSVLISLSSVFSFINYRYFRLPRTIGLMLFALAAAGTILSTWLVGVWDWQVFRLMGPQIPLTYCLLFRALISPTDPVAKMLNPQAGRVDQAPNVIMPVR